MTKECTVMVVDDNVDNLNLISAVLTSADYRVLPALSGELALKASGSVQDLGSTSHFFLHQGECCFPEHGICRQINRDFRLMRDPQKAVMREPLFRLVTTCRVWNVDGRIGSIETIDTAEMPLHAEINFPFYIQFCCALD
jgi:hypothetical protein